MLTILKTIKEIYNGVGAFLHICFLKFNIIKILINLCYHLNIEIKIFNLSKKLVILISMDSQEKYKVFF